MASVIVNATRRVLIKFYIHLRERVGSDFSLKMNDSMRVTAGASYIGYVKNRLQVKRILSTHVKTDVDGRASVIKRYSLFSKS